jgi:hypothetical protein
MKKVICIVWMGLCLAAHAGASDDKRTEESAATCSLKGRVYDPVCREAISGASLTVDGVKYYSDLDGRFSVSSLQKGVHSISVDFISYRSQEMQIEINEAVRDIEIALRQQ